MPLFNKNKKLTNDLQKQERLQNLLKDNLKLSNELKQATTTKNMVQNQIEQIKHDEEVISNLKPQLEQSLKLLSKGSKQLAQDQRKLEKSFDKLKENMTSGELVKAHLQFHNAEPTAPSDDTMSLPSYESANTLYPSLPQTSTFVITDELGQEKITEVPSYPVQPGSSSGPYQNTRAHSSRFNEQLHKSFDKIKNMTDELISRSQTPSQRAYSTPRDPPAEELPPAEPIPTPSDDDSTLSGTNPFNANPFLDPPNRQDISQKRNIREIPLREYSEHLATLPPFAKGTTVVKWISRCLRMVPHGNGDTPHDRALLNRLITLLRKSKTEKGSAIADALTTLLQADDLTWANILNMISQSFPSGMVELSDKIINTVQSFDWSKHNATLHFTPSFMEAGIPLKLKTISATDHGLDYLSRIRRRIPEAIQVNLLGMENQTWSAFFTKLQDYQNMIQGDKKRLIYEPPTPASSFLAQPARRSNRPSNPPQRLGTNIGHLPRRNPPNTTRRRQNPNANSEFETALEKALKLETGQPFTCYTCGRKGHKSADCLVKAVLDHCNKKLIVDPGTGIVHLEERLPLTGVYKQRHDNEWLPFLRGRNALGRRIISLNDLNTLMNQYQERSYRATRNPYQRPTDSSWKRTKERAQGHQWQPRGANDIRNNPSTRQSQPQLSPRLSNTSLSSELTDDSAPIFAHLPYFPKASENY